MVHEDRIKLIAHVERGKISRVDVRSERSLGVIRVLLGRPFEQALTLVSNLFALCGTAQRIAALEGIERALGVEVSPSHTRARRILVVAEAIDQHLRTIMLTWAEAVGAKPNTKAYVAMRRPLLGLDEQLYSGSRPLRVGGGRLAPEHAAVERRVKQLEATVKKAKLLPRGADLPELTDWIEDHKSPSARALRHVLDRNWTAKGASDVQLLPRLSAEWFDTRLADASSFSTAPTFEGRPAEPGPLARRRAAPLVATCVESGGHGLFARMVARLVDLRENLVELRALVHTLEPTEGPAGIGARFGAGTGVAETVRGPVAHRVEIDDGKVEGWAFVAPTEWNFHERGAAVEGLLGQPSTDSDWFPWHLMAIDPCVPCTIETEGK